MRAILYLLLLIALCSLIFFGAWFFKIDTEQGRIFYGVMSGFCVVGVIFTFSKILNLPKY